MITSLALIFLVGLSMAFISSKIKIPRIIGMLITGIVLGPFVLDFLDPSILGISSELRKMALIIILIKAGLSLNVKDLKQVGRPAILMSFLPAVFEIVGCVIFAPMFLPVTRLEAAVIGAVLGAVSPAVVVPRMVELMEKKYGTDKKIPQLILAGASLDDVFVIVLFQAFLGMAQGNGISVRSFIDVPVSIVLGIGLGALAGFVLVMIFDLFYNHQHKIRNSVKVIIILGLAFLLMAVQGWVEKWVAVSGLLAVMSMACLIQMRSCDEVAKRLSQKYGKLWLAAEVVLFVMVGAAVDIRYAMDAGLETVIVIFIALAFRCVGVLLCLLGTELNAKERLYCVISYLPKATVQAAIGSVPLSLGLPCGNMVLSVAVISILITAPLGAFLMDLTYRKLLVKEDDA
ncbi:MAG: cation:proton antiporter [Treponema sp.]|uniref:cation:proton antiporter n=1 Tax=Treponema sp. TaxID=166 RepID=UPI00298DABA3|nr:cation:proton antiporter [Treponema sp.]MCQ2600627.1 cation:proton antiporter [Treponema sp.]